MHYLFYGEDIFSINEKTKSLVKKFSREHCDLNIFNLDGANMTFENYVEAVETLPFLGTKKLIIIKDLLLENKDNDLKKEIAKKLKKMSDASTILFVERGLPDMRSALFKTLNQPKFIQKFDFSSPGMLSNWINQKVLDEGGTITPEAKTKLQVFVGPDFWRLENEILKLVLLKKARKTNDSAISADDVEEMVEAENNTNIFQFIDALAGKDSKKALNNLDALIRSGEDEFYIFTMIIYQFRNLLMISELLEDGSSLNQIATETKIHPFVIRKNKEVLKNFDNHKLRTIYQELQRFDYKIKSGLLDLRLALDLLTVRLSLTE